MKTTLQEFIEAFSACALWTSMGDNEEPLDRDFNTGDFSESLNAAIQRECSEFFEAQYERIQDDVSRAGHDFFLTRNECGAGFWDGDWPINGDELTKASKAFGEFDLYVGDDGQIYASGYENEKSIPCRTPVNSIQIPARFLKLCEEWHDGQESMFYAVCSSKNLWLGHNRPTGAKTDEQWYLHLWRALSKESHHLTLFKKQEMVDDGDKILEFQVYCQQTVNKLAREYGLEEWEAA